MDGKMLARLGAVVFVAVAVTATAIEMTRKEEAPPAWPSGRSTEAQGIALNVQQIDRAFQTTYGNASMSASDQALVAGARERWQNTVGGLQDAMRVQAGVVGNIDTNRSEMTALVGQSQGATGALQATQAGNQLLALQAQQLADLTAVVAANGRAQSLSEAERAAAAEQGREQRRRFLTPGTGYQPGNARMFQNSGN